MDVVAANTSSVRHMALYVRNVKARTTSRKCAEEGNIRRKYFKLRQHVDNNDDSSNYLFVGTVTGRKHSTNTDQKWQAVINVQGNSVRFKLDTGSGATVLQINVLNEIKSAKLEETTTLLCAFGENQVVPLGIVMFECTTDKGDTEQLLFFVTGSADVPVLGHKACDKLNLVKRVYMRQPMRQPQRRSLTKYEMISEYEDVFTGVGQYDKEYSVELIANAQGVIQPPPKFPYAIQPKFKEALDGLKAQNIIADVDRPTDWVSNLVIVENKSGALRLCLDPRPLNVAIKRERHAIPTPDDVQAQLSGMNVFTVVDMKDGYWHVKLSEESSYYCTLNTPWGRKRFLRMPFGISSASKIMQKRNEETFGDIQGVQVIADDLIIAAKDDQ